MEELKKSLLNELIVFIFIHYKEDLSATCITRHCAQALQIQRGIKQSLPLKAHNLVIKKNLQSCGDGAMQQILLGKHVLCMRWKMRVCSVSGPEALVRTS